MKKEDTVLYLAILVMLFDFVSPIPGNIKFVIAILLVVAIIATAVMRIVGGIKNQQTPDK